MAFKQVQYVINPTFGCDPEFFFERGGEVIGAERIIPEGGVEQKILNDTRELHSNGKLVLDGVQVELNPSPAACRAYLGNDISACFKKLKEHLKGMEGVKASFSQLITLSQKELDSLSEQSKKFGCMPSKNCYNSSAKVYADASTCLQRSAGGHIHLGLKDYNTKDKERMVPILDILLGNTCVLLDRDPGNAERRKNYGRAGEYRLPKHGLEYRTLSNFWLRAYPLMSLVMAVSRLAVNVIGTTKQGGYGEYGWDAEGTLLKANDLGKIERAINENNLTLALENWENGVKPFLRDHATGWGTGLGGHNIPQFEFFFNRILKEEEEKGVGEGLKAWFPQDPLEHWCSLPDGHRCGWENFVENKIAPEMRRGEEAS